MAASTTRQRRRRRTTAGEPLPPQPQPAAAAADSASAAPTPPRPARRRPPPAASFGMLTATPTLAVFLGVALSSPSAKGGSVIDEAHWPTKLTTNRSNSGINRPFGGPAASSAAGAAGTSRRRRTAGGSAAAAAAAFEADFAEARDSIGDVTAHETAEYYWNEQVPLFSSSGAFNLAPGREGEPARPTSTGSSGRRILSRAASANLHGRVEAKPQSVGAAEAGEADGKEEDVAVMGSSATATRGTAATKAGATTANAAKSRAAAAAAADEEEIVDIAEGKDDAAAAAKVGAGEKSGADPRPAPKVEDEDEASDADSNADADADAVVDLKGDDGRKGGGESARHHERAHDGGKEGKSGAAGEADASDDDAADKAERCVPLGECEQCPGNTKRADAEEGCAETGRRQRFECIVSRGEEELKRYKIYRSCKRTVADEEFLMMRMQVICVLMGTLSVLSVRRQKRASASLFDQRRRMGDGGGGSSRVVYTSVPQGGPAENGGISPTGGGGGADDLSVSTSGTTGVEMV